MLNQPLSARAQAWLRKQEADLKALGSKRIKTKQQAAQEVLSWCQEQDLIAANSLQLVEVKLDKPLLNRIAETQQELEQTSFREDLSNKTRLEQAVLSNQEQKRLGHTPRHNRLLIRLAQPLPTGFNVSAQFLDLRLEELDLSKFTRLLVVENLDCFYELEKFAVTETPEQLVVYRGDKTSSQGSKALRKAWLAANKPAYYFGDFDPAGVKIALAGKTYQSMLLPKLDVLQKMASAAILPNEQLKYLPNLAKQTNLTPEFQNYCQTLHELKALRQQAMQGMDLVAVDIFKP
ncbi:DUF7281 domain-containing protein [Marinospirillum insulare]|uniref:DUF7281 domain-containing protein n=1 Tax=Marinospirillum insulare TaxID=217169 RepID=A0ABQ5ZRU5_9GAMM|nr:Wadjet anti-phage system protein JetD domain-containing protein [Marinospirillum insulare]GLR62874.1 hypothetical protein GCM10007878_03090 [Marinospirillum insulare]